jgi:hypothetical protein
MLSKEYGRVVLLCDNMIRHCQNPQDQQIRNANFQNSQDQQIRNANFQNSQDQQICHLTKTDIVSIQVCNWYAECRLERIDRATQLEDNLVELHGRFSIYDYLWSWIQEDDSMMDNLRTHLQSLSIKKIAQLRIVIPEDNIENCV